MAEYKAYIGNVGPFVVDDDVTYDDGKPMCAGRFDGPVMCMVDPADDNHLVRKGYMTALVTEAIGNPIQVEDLNAPDAALAEVHGIRDGSLRVVTDGIESTLYMWTANTQPVDSPYVLPGNSGTWIAISGAYEWGSKNIDGVVEFNSAVTFNSDVTVSGILTAEDSLFAQTMNAQQANVSGSLDVGGSSTIGTDLDLGGTLQVAGVTTLKGDVNIGKAGSPSQVSLYNANQLKLAFQSDANGLSVIGPKVFLGPDADTVYSLGVYYDTEGSAIEISTGGMVDNGIKVLDDLIVAGYLVAYGDRIDSSSAQVLALTGADAGFKGNVSVPATKRITSNLLQSLPGYTLYLRQADVNLGLAIEPQGNTIVDGDIYMTIGKSIFASGGTGALQFGEDKLVVLGLGLTVDSGVFFGVGGATALTLSDGNASTPGSLTTMGDSLCGSAGQVASFSGVDTILAGTLKVVGDVIKDSTGASPITMAGADVKFGGDIWINGADIRDASGTTVITLSPSNATVAGSLKLGGNVIKDAAGVTAITTDGANVSVAGALSVAGIAAFAQQIVADTLVVEDVLATDLITGANLKLTTGIIYSSGNIAAMTVAADGKVTFGTDIQLGGNDIFASDGTKAITVAGANVQVQGILHALGNQINSSTGIAMVLSGNDVEVAGNLKIDGTLLKDSLGAVVLTLTAAKTTVAGDIQIGGNDIIAGNGTSAISLNGADATFAGNVTLNLPGSVLKASYIKAHDDTTLKIYDFDGVTGIEIAHAGTVKVLGNLQLGTNIIANSANATAITLTGITVVTAADLKVGSNIIRSTGGQATITMDNADVIFAGDIQVSGNDIKSSSGDAAITLSGTAATARGNFTVTGELAGCRKPIWLTQDAAQVVNNTTYVLKVGELTGAYDKAPTMLRAGSMTGFSINYDITVSTSGGGSFQVEFVIWKNNLPVYAYTLDPAVGVAKKAYATIPRGTYPFVAGDHLHGTIRVTNGSITIAKVVVEIETTENS